MRALGTIWGFKILDHSRNVRKTIKPNPGGKITKTFLNLMVSDNRHPEIHQILGELYVRITISFNVEKNILRDCDNYFFCRSFKTYYAIYFQFFPEIIFITCLFLWLVFMIYFKWFLYSAKDGEWIIFFIILFWNVRLLALHYIKYYISHKILLYFVGNIVFNVIDFLIQICLCDFV